MNFELATAPTTKLLSLLPGPLPQGQLAVVSDTSTTPVRYRGLDAALSNLDVQMQRAIRWVGRDAEGVAHARPRGRVVLGAAAGLGALAAGAAAYFVGKWDPVGALLTAAAVGGVGYGVSSFLWTWGCNVWRNVRAKKPPSESALVGLRGVATGETESFALATLAVGAKQWQRTLEKQHVLGFDAQELLEGLEKRGMTAGNADQRQAQRLSDVRDAVEACRTIDEASAIETLRAAFDALPSDEQRELAPLVIDELFRDDAPRQRWTFKNAFALHTRLSRIAEGLTPEPAAAAPAEAEAPSDTESAEGVDQPAAADVNAVTVEHASTIATIESTLAGFEAVLGAAVKKTSVLPRDIAPALAIAKAPQRTPVELVALGTRAKRFVAQLDERRIYGYEARKQLLELAQTAESMAPALRDQIQRIDNYRATIARVGPDAVSDGRYGDVLKAINELMPCDRRMGAELAYARYFKNGVPRGRLHYEDGQSFLKALRAHLKTQ